MKLLRNVVLVAYVAGQALCAAAPAVLPVPAPAAVPAPAVPILNQPPGVVLTLDGELAYGSLNSFTLPALTKVWDQMPTRLNAALKSNRDYKQLINNSRLALSGSVLAASLALATYMCRSAQQVTPDNQSLGTILTLASGMFAGTSCYNFFDALYTWAQGPGPVYRVVCNQLQSKQKYGVAHPCLNVKVHGAPIKDPEDKQVLYGLLQSIPQKVNGDIASSLTWTGMCNGARAIAAGAVFASGLASLGYLGATMPLTELNPTTATLAAMAVGTACAGVWSVRSMMKFARGPRIFGNPPSLATVVTMKEKVANGVA